MNKNICFLIIIVNLIFNNDGKPFIFDDQMIDFINDQHFTWKVSNVFFKSFNSVLELTKLLLLIEKAEKNKFYYLPLYSLKRLSGVLDYNMNSPSKLDKKYHKSLFNIPGKNNY